ncbi:hypothetical protein [Klebsiella pneumoniae]
MSILAGNMYESIGFRGAYLAGSGGAGLHLISVGSRLAARDPLSLPCRRE